MWGRLGLCIQASIWLVMYLLLVFFESALNIRLIASKANLAETTPALFACLRIEAWVASSALGENHAPLGCGVHGFPKKAV